MSELVCVYLVIVTLILVFLGCKLFYKSQSHSFIIGLLVIYFWTLYGGWLILFEVNQPLPTTNFIYITERLFPVNLDLNYFLALVLYTLFVVLLMLFVLFFIKPLRKCQDTKVYVRGLTVFGIGFLALLFSVATIKDSLISAVRNNCSPYEITRLSQFGDNNLFTIHQLANYMAIFCSVFGLGLTLFKNRQKRIFIYKGGLGSVVLLTILFILTYFYNLVLGNRSALLEYAIGAALLVIYNSRVNFWNISPGAFLFIISLMVIAVARGSPFGNAFYFNSNIIGELIYSSFNNHEAIFPHLSLYGVLSHDVPIIPGYSFISLIASVIPRLFWKDRPADIYEYYASAVDSKPGQGYTIHHATGWYLNFGLIGIVIGAVLLGYIWVTLFNNLNKAAFVKSQLKKIFYGLSFFTFTGALPFLLRGGLENYKGVFIENLIIPTLIFYLASIKIRFR